MCRSGQVNKRQHTELEQGLTLPVMGSCLGRGTTEECVTVTVPFLAATCCPPHPGVETGILFSQPTKRRHC